MTPGLYQTKYWQVRLPDGWVVDQTRPTGSWEDTGDSLIDLVTFYSPSGVGTLSFLTRDEAYDDTGVGQPFRGNVTGKYYGEKAHEGSYWRKWRLACMGRTLSITYRCSEKNSNLEREQVDEILLSIEDSSLLNN